MGTLNLTSSKVGASLLEIMNADEIEPGSDPSYQLCKLIYAYHPIGAKMAGNPVKLAMSLDREITIPDSPEEMVRDAFLKQWIADDMDETIWNLATQARVYGVASLAVMVKDLDADQPLPLEKLADLSISFNVLDPLNTAGSLVLDQDPNSLDFQKIVSVSVSGKPYHRSRTLTLMNEKPIYIQYTNSAFGYVGRSVYQRALFPLKSFISTMVTDDMVVRKVGVLIAKLKQPGSIIDNIMSTMAGTKRQLLKEAETENVLSVSTEENIESLDLQNLEAPLTTSRKNILENIASSADMPAKLLTEESMSSSFNEGTEESKRVAQYVDDVRKWLQRVYDFLDPIVQRRAWNEEFYKTIQDKFPEEYGDKTYNQAFYEWSNAFSASWPSFIREPESELIKVDQTKFETAVAVVEILKPDLDPENKATLIQWLCDTISERKMLFSSPLVLDYDALKDYAPPQPGMTGGEQEEGPDGLVDKEPPEPRPFRAIKDSQPTPIVGRLRGRIKEIG